jgi:hypothetical protein
MGGDTRVSFVDVETKEQSKQLMHTHSPKLNKRCLSARKLMATVFWDSKGVLMVEFMQQGSTITPEVYSKNTKKKELHRAIQNKRREMLTSIRVYLHNNARPHTAARTRALLEHFNGSCLTILLTALILLQVTNTCLLIHT